METKYQNWINSYKEKHKVLAGLCFPACSLMLKDFPELTICRGYIVDGWGKRYTHWFLKTDNDEIIDPTISQFDYLLDGGNLKYEEYSEGLHGPLSTGKCMDCGKLLYNNETFCNSICSENTSKYLSKINSRI